MTNNIPSQPTSRIDQIEAILLQVVTQQQVTATALNRIAEQQEVNTNALSQLTTRVDNLTVQIGALGEDLQNTIDILMESINHAETDREAWQSEIKRIWEYLFGQNQNGHTS